MLASIHSLLTGASRNLRRREERAARRAARSGVVSLRLEALEERAVFTAGDLDPGFGTGGVVSNADYTWNSQAVQSDGKIVLVGSYNTGVTNDVAVMRLNTDGSLDTSFGGDGVVTFDLGASGDVARDVAIDASGDIVVAGTRLTSSSTGSGFVMKLNSDGSLDTSFDGDGTALVTMGGTLSYVQSVAIDASGRILVGGRVLDGANFDAAVARLTTSGALDTNFSSDGYVTFDTGLDDAINAIAVRADGSLVAVGNAGTGAGTDVLAIGVTSSGNLDVGFGASGTTTVNVAANSADFAYDAAFDSSGRLVIAGSTSVSGVQDALAIRLNTAGLLDSSFSGDGIATVDFNGQADAATGVAIDANGNVVLTGSAGSTLVGLARLLGSNGSLDTSFSTDGKTTFDVGNFSIGRAIALTANGSFVLTVNGFTNSGFGFVNVGGVLLISNSQYGLSINASGDGDASIDVNEGAASGTAIATLQGTGFAQGATLTYSLASNPGNLFSIVGNQLRVNGSLDFESAASRTVTVQVSDGTNTFFQQVSITVNNLAPSLPVDVNAVANTVAVGASAGATVGVTASSSDPAGGTVTYSLTNDASGRFVINSQTGVISVAQGATFATSDGSYTVTVRASDGKLTSSADFVISVVSQQLGLNVDGNVDGDASVDVNEGAATGTAVANLQGTGFAQGATLTYSLTSNPGSLFSIVGNQLRVNGSLNFETAASRTVTVQVSDGTNTYSQDITVNVNNVAPSVSVDANAAANVVNVGATAGTAVGVTASATDPAGGTVTYSLTNDANGRFVINSQTGVVSVASGATFSTNDGSYVVTVQASDGNLTSSANFAINVAGQLGLNVDGNVDGDASVDVNEGAATGTAIANLQGTGFAQGATLTYSLTSNPNNLFSIVGNQLRVNGVLNYETAATRTVTVQVSDGTNTYSQDVTVNVNNLAPSVAIDANGASNLVNVGATAGTAVGVTASATDPAGGTVTYSLTNDANGRFVINSQTGVISVAQGATFATSDGSYSVTVQASDGSAVSSSNFTISVGSQVQNNSVFLAADPTLAGVTSLFVYGTNASDAIRIGYSNGQYVVKINGAFVGGSYTLTSDARIFVYGLDGNDYMEMNVGTVNRVVMDGGSGDDEIYGGRAADILLGGAGNDWLDGRGGRDLLIGGLGADRVFAEGDGSVGSAEGNIVIGDRTAYDADLAALTAISASWAANDASTNTTVRSYLNSGTVLGDGISDSVRLGSGGIDYAFGFELDGAGALLDRFSNVGSNDFIN